MPWRPGALELLNSFADAGVPVRAGVRVLPGAAGRGAGPAARGHLPGVGGRRRGRPGQAPPRAVRDGPARRSTSTPATAWCSRTPRPGPGPGTRPARLSSPCPTVSTYPPPRDGCRSVRWPSSTLAGSQPAAGAGRCARLSRAAPRAAATAGRRGHPAAAPRLSRAGPDRRRRPRPRPGRRRGRSP